MDQLVGVGDVHMVKNILEIWKRESISVGKEKGSCKLSRGKHSDVPN